MIGVEDYIDSTRAVLSYLRERQGSKSLGHRSGFRGAGGQQIAATWMMSSLAGLVHEGLGDLITFGPPPGAGPLILSEEADPTARLSFGYPVTDRLSVTYSIALDSTERRLWILDYRVARNFWIRAIQENASDYAFGVSQRLSFDLRRRARKAPSPQP